MDISELKRTALNIRRKTVISAHKTGACHIGGSLSTVEILTVLYYGVMRTDPLNPDWGERDRFILSKGHGAIALYCILADKGFIPASELDRIKKLGSLLQGHPVKAIPGIEMSSGSLGQGISFAAGKAFSLKHSGSPSRVFVLVGDGELQEGQNWEALPLAAKLKLGNLTVIVDRNKLQLDDTVENVLDCNNFEDKFRAFNWDTETVNGHSIDALESVLSGTGNGKPRAVIADTVKGKGVSFMENAVSWHAGAMSDEQLALALKELASETER